MPKKNTDKLLLKSDVTVRICRKLGTRACEPTGPDLQISPGASGSFAETLPTALITGPPRALNYFIELRNHNGRSAGLSNTAVVPAGAAPAPVADLTAEIRKSGVVLRWAASDGAEAQEAVRLQRKLLTPPTGKTKPGLLEPQPEPLEQSLLVEQSVPGRRVLDKEIRFGNTYEYRAQRVARVVSGDQTLELAGELSAPVRIVALDVFPPAVPTGLAAVATTGESAAAIMIDLSWQAVTDADLAGYAVYRRDGDNAWQRISPAKPLIGPAFRDTEVQSGHTYRYAVSAIDQGGHESARSAEAQETVPTP
jgi:hypothetical protein